MGHFFFNNELRVGVLSYNNVVVICLDDLDYRVENWIRKLKFKNVVNEMAV